MRILLLSWLFFLPICSVLLGVEMGTVSGQCLSDQKALLLQLKNSLLPYAPKSKKLVQWNQNLDCCSWDGVTCDGGGVTGLNLSCEWISGEIGNSSLFNLQHLQRLDLSFNNFSSTISSRIGNLTNLTYLNLSNAGFGEQIPGGISELTKLVTLDISTLSLLQISSLRLENPNLTMLVRNLSRLEELYLDGINISAHGNEWGRALSSSVPNLRVLSLSNCYLSGPLSQSLETLHSLSVIRLDNNNLSSLVPIFLAKLSNLTTLSLSSCGLHGAFPREIFNVPTLQNIDISHNLLLQGSLPEFRQTSALRRVVLRETNMSDGVPASISNLWNLSRLELANCQFTGRLPSSMAELTQLLYIDLSQNRFNGTIPSFKKSKNLSEVNLAHNDFTGNVPSENWEGLWNLVVVDLRYNSLHGSVPLSLFALPSLQKIQLASNRFSGQVPDFSIATSSMLDILDLSGNNLEGNVPASIFKLRKLSVLSLSSNKLEGTIQLKSIQELSSLTTLDLSHNNLSLEASGNYSASSPFSKISTLKLVSCNLTKFPNLKNQTKLNFLDLSNNQIHGDIPNWIWEADNLTHMNLSYNYLSGMQEPYSLPMSLNAFDLHQNQLQGKIPILPPAASYIDLSSNNFSSAIPADIGNNLSVNIFFSLSNNNLEGTIPKSICKAKNILVLDFSNSSLGGKIPPCMSEMSQTLRVINLRHNHFTGPIPDAFPAKCGLKSLDLNGNSIEGVIPKSLTNCTELEVLNLGNNNLSDKYPCMLKKIPNLRVLVLRSNRFSGKIGCHHINGTWAKLQIVDLAHNAFDGQLPGKCFTKWQAMKDHENDAEFEFNYLQFQILKFTPVYYQDAVTVTLKGLEVEFAKILSILIAIDVSCNNLVGPIPSEVGQLRALVVLNLSNNALTGEIPSSIGNLSGLESLDLSNNTLSGEIPASLANLYFLSFLNVSFNRLVGTIPTGSQIQTFSEDSFKGNAGLCGPPLSKSCGSPSNSTDAESGIASGVEFNWQSIYSGIGFGVGSGAVVALLMFWEEGKNWLEGSIDKILLVILLMLGYAYTPRDEWDDEDDTSDAVSDLAEDDEEDETENGELQGRYCVFCSKFDTTMTRVIHDPRCTCHSLPTSFSSSFSSATSSYSP